MDAQTQSSLRLLLWTQSDQSKEKKSEVRTAHTIVFFFFPLDFLTEFKWEEIDIYDGSLGN